MNMFSKKDILKIEYAIMDLKEMREKEIKAKKEILLDNGYKVTAYHLGKNNKTIRIDINA